MRQILKFMSRIIFIKAEGFYPGSQAPFWGAVLGRRGDITCYSWFEYILVRLCHPIDGLGGLLTNFFFGAMVKLHIVSCCLSCLLITNIFKIYDHIFCASDHKLLNFLV